MARVTVEDCTDKIPNTFELVLAAAARAKIICSGGEVTVSIDNDKPPVLALREIAKGNVDVEKLKEKLIDSMRSKRFAGPADDENENLQVDAKDNIKEDFDDATTEIYVRENHSNIDNFGDESDLADDDELQEEDK